MSKPKVGDEQKMIKDAEDWTAAMHREMVAATLMNPSLITYRSLALGIPEAEVRRRLEEDLCKKYTTVRGK